MLGCWEEKTIDVEAVPGNGRAFSASMTPTTTKAVVIPFKPDEEAALLEAKEILALPPSPLEEASRRRQRQVLIASAIISLLVSFLTVAALTHWLIKRDIAIALSELNKKGDAVTGKGENKGAGAQTIKVAVRVEKGQVVRAFVEEHRPGMEAYESLALRIARARRYSVASSGQEWVQIRINPPD
jgi:hypothetical protein